MDEDSRLEKVDRYLMGKMTPDEKKKFEELLAHDEEWRTLVDVQKRLIAGMEKYKERASFLQMLTEIKEDHSNPVKDEVQPKVVDRDNKMARTVRMWGMTRILAYAASLLLLVGALVFIFKGPSNPSDLAEKHFAFYPDVMTENIDALGAVDDLNKHLHPLLREAIESYRSGSYEEAESLLQQFRSEAEGSSYLLVLTDFYLAQIALHHNDAQSAIGLLLTISEESGLPIASAVEWYLALAYLNLDDTDQAAELLRDLADHVEYGERAASILKKINHKD